MAFEDITANDKRKATEIILMLKASQIKVKRRLKLPDANKRGPLYRPFDGANVIGLSVQKSAICK